MISSPQVVFISGDASPGSPNDRRLSAVVGPRWRELTGADRPVLARGCSPGFHVGAYWPCVERDYERVRRGEPPTGPDWPMRALLPPAGAPAEAGGGDAGGEPAASPRRVLWPQ